MLMIVQLCTMCFDDCTNILRLNYAWLILSNILVHFAGKVSYDLSVECVAHVHDCAGSPGLSGKVSDRNIKEKYYSRLDQASFGALFSSVHQPC